MSRQFLEGLPVIDHFPVFEADGYTKKTGVGGFVSTVWKEGVEQAVTVTITEVGATGEYKTSFTPTSSGVWTLEVKIPYNEEIYEAEYYTIVAEGSRFKFTMTDDGTTITLGVWLIEAGQKRTDITNMTAKIRDKTGAIVVDLGSNSSPAIGVFWFTKTATLTAKTPYVIDMTATDGVGNWQNSLGIAKA